MGGSTDPDRNSSVESQKRKQVALDEDEDDPGNRAPASPTSSVSSINSVSTEGSTSTSMRDHKKSKQPRLDLSFATQASFQDGGSKAINITNTLVFMLAKDNMPLRTVEKEGFNIFMKTIAPLYKVPSRKLVTSRVDEKYEVLSNLMKDKLSQISHITLTTDIWTDTVNTRSYLGLTAHYILKDSLKSVTIGITELNQSHTSANLAVWLLEILQEWRMEKENVIAVVSDNAANITKAIKDVFGPEKQIFCFAHTLNLVPSKIIEKDECVHSSCAKIKNIVRYFKQSVTAADQLRTHTSLSLIQSVDTRWNSTYTMIKRFIELADTISLILLNSPSGPPMLTAHELQTAKEFLDLLKPFEEATRIICGESYVTASKVIPIVNTLKSKLEQYTPKTDTGKHLKNCLMEQFVKRFNRIEYLPILAAATILDPRFKNINFVDKIACSNAINMITKSINRTVTLSNQENPEEIDRPTSPTTNNENNFWSYHEQLINRNKSRFFENHDQNQMPDELKMYLHQLPIGMTENPIAYWNCMNSSALKDLALKHLTLTATSVPSERMFSNAGNILTDDRSRLTSKHLQALLFLSSLSFEDWHM